jgi:hypothetical protein
MSTIIQASPLAREGVARTTANRRFLCLDYLRRLGRSDETKADPGPLQPRM